MAIWWPGFTRGRILPAITEHVNRAAQWLTPWRLYALGALPALALIWRIYTGDLGVDPLKTIEHRLGEVALQLIVAGLVITPLRRLAGVNLIRQRRQIGVLAFVYTSLHLAVWIALDLQFRWSEIGADLVKRPYIILGMAAFVLLVPLAVTSNNAAIRRLGGVRWRRLHWLVYPAAILAAAHYVILVKGWQTEPLLYMAVILGLLGLRILRPGRKTPRPVGG